MKLSNKLIAAFVIGVVVNLASTFVISQGNPQDYTAFEVGPLNQVVKCDNSRAQNNNVCVSEYQTGWPLQWGDGLVVLSSEGRENNTQDTNLGLYAGNLAIWFGIAAIPLFAYDVIKSKKS